MLIFDMKFFRCHVCPKTFRVKKSLLQHLEKFHQDTSGYTQPRPGSPQSSFKAHSVKGSPIVSTQAIPSVPLSMSSTSSQSVTITPKMPNTSSPSLLGFNHSSNKSSKNSGFNHNNSSETRNPLLSSSSSKTLLHSNRDSFLKSTSNKNGISGLSGSKPNPVTCSNCGKSFSRQSVLNVHSQMVHGAASSIKSLNKTNSIILAAVKQSVVSSSVSTAGAAATMPTDDDSTSVGSNFECSIFIT